jgi:hypothetical protein
MRKTLKRGKRVRTYIHIYATYAYATYAVVYLSSSDSGLRKRTGYTGPNRPRRDPPPMLLLREWAHYNICRKSGLSLQERRTHTGVRGYSLPMLHNKKAPESPTSVRSNTAGWEVLLPHRRLRQVSFRGRLWAQLGGWPWGRGTHHDSQPNHTQPHPLAPSSQLKQRFHSKTPKHSGGPNKQARGSASDWLEPIDSPLTPQGAWAGCGPGPPVGVTRAHAH